MKQRGRTPDEDREHGWIEEGVITTVARYNFGCRCDACRSALAEAARRRVAVNTARLAADPSLAQHGRYSTYVNWGCRCEACRAAGAERNAKITRRRRAS